MDNVIQRLIWPSKKLVKQVVIEAQANNQVVRSAGRGVLVILPRSAANQDFPRAA